LWEIWCDEGHAAVEFFSWVGLLESGFDFAKEWTMVYDAAYKKSEIEVGRQCGSMLRCCFCCCAHFSIPWNTAVARDPHEGNDECVVVESSKESENSCS